MGLYCGWTDDWDGEWLEPIKEFSAGDVKCRDCGAMIGAGAPIHIHSWADDDGAQHDIQICDACSDLYESLIEAGHEPGVGQARLCAAEAQAMRPYRKTIDRAQTDPTVTCGNCIWFRCGSCQHVDESEFEIGETTYQVNELADKARWEGRTDDLRYYSGKRAVPQDHFCAYWEAA